MEVETGQVQMKVETGQVQMEVEMNQVQMELEKSQGTAMAALAKAAPIKMEA